MTQLTQDEIRDEMLSLFENSEDELLSYATKIEKIEDDSMMYFEMKEIALKNRIAEDSSIPEDEVEKKYIEGLEILRKEVLESTQLALQELLKKQEATHTAE